MALSCCRLNTRPTLNLSQIMASTKPTSNEAENGNKSKPLLATVRAVKPQYLVRSNDCSIFDLDESNNCYRGWSRKPIIYQDGTRPKAMEHFTFENLTQNYGFFKIDENEIETYEQKCDEHYKFLSWKSRSDGHGGSKGGTYEEYLARN